MPKYFKTEIKISKKATKKNISIFRNLLDRKTKLMAVVKSNAYGHGILTIPKLIEKDVDWFGVDSMAEAKTLRDQKIKKPILVFGYTFPSLYNEAEKLNISLSFYNFEERKILKKYPNLKVHIKIDTGMHRQGVYVEDLDSFLRSINKNQIEGIYTHFAGAKDPKFKPYTLMQISNFNKAIEITSNFTKSFLKHACSTSATIHYSDCHFDMVRIGARLYGLGLSSADNMGTVPIMSWESVVAQVKKVRKDFYIGYNLTEKAKEEKFVAVIPIGYWHGFGRNLSSIGEVLVRGHRAKVLGIVSMDVIVVGFKKGFIPKVGEKVVIIGKSGKVKITVREIGKKTGTVDSEIVTRINPLIPRKLI